MDVKDCEHKDFVHAWGSKYVLCARCGKKIEMSEYEIAEKMAEANEWF